MPAYKISDLYNKYIHDQVLKALQTGCISGESYTRVSEAHPVRLYTPNYFIRIALGLLTVVAVLFIGLLTALILSASDGGAISAVLVLLALLCYGTLEILVRKKRYYNAGIDNVLMLLVAGLAASAFLAVESDPSWPLISLVSMAICLALCLRFTDAFMAGLSYGCFFIFIFLAYLKFGMMARSTAPFLMMTVSGFVYILIKKQAVAATFQYRRCFIAVIVLTLVTFYLSGNYFVVWELSDQMLPGHSGGKHVLPFGWLFWLFTVTIPVLYVIYGVLKKDLLMMRTGLALIAVSIFTVNYYHNMATAAELLIIGLALISVSYILIKYLKIARRGFTSVDSLSSSKEIANAEAILTSETFTPPPTIENTGLFGGGSGGGGGSSGTY